MDHSGRQGFLNNLTVNAFSINGITKVYWKEYKGSIPIIYACIQELHEASQACFACLGELASPLSNKYHHQQSEETEPKSSTTKSNGPTKPLSRLEDDLLHLYVFAWTSESAATQSTILDRYSLPTDATSMETPESTRSGYLELLSSGDWQTNGGYSINEAPRKASSTSASLLKAPFVSSAGPTVPHPGRTAAQQTPLFVSHSSSALATTQSKLRHNLTKLLFKSIEDLLHHRMAKESFVKVGEYYVLVPDQDGLGQARARQQAHGSAIALKFKFFVSGDDSPHLCFHTKIVKTTLYPLPSISSPWSIYHANNPAVGAPILVATAPCGIVGFLSDPTELACPPTRSSSSSSSVSKSKHNQAQAFQPISSGSPPSSSPNSSRSAPLDRDSVLSQWRKLHNIVSTSTISVTIAGVAYQFPRSAVFLLSPPDVSSGTPSLIRQAIPSSTPTRLTPLQLYQELSLQEFGTSMASSMTQTSFFDSLENWAPSHSSTLIEALNSHAASLCAASAPNNPKKRQRTPTTQINPAFGDDDLDFARQFSLDTALLLANETLMMSSNTDPHTSMTSMGISGGNMESTMDTTGATGYLNSQNDPQLGEEDGEMGAEPLDMTDVFDDRVADDADDWGFATAPNPIPSSSMSSHNMSNLPMSSDAAVDGTGGIGPLHHDPYGPASSDMLSTKKSDKDVITPAATEYVTPAGVFSPGFDIGVRPDSVLAFTSPIPRGEGNVASMVIPEDAEMGDYDPDEGSGDDDDISSHLSLSDEDDNVARRVWNHSLPVSMQSISDVCPDAYKPLGMSNKSYLSDLVSSIFLASGSAMNLDPQPITSQIISSNATDGTPTGEATQLNEEAVESDLDSDSDDSDSESTLLAADSASVHSIANGTRPSQNGSASVGGGTGTTGNSSIMSASQIAHTLFDTHQDEASALFTGNSTNFASFSPRAFAITAWNRLAVYAAGDSARLCFVSRLCNFFETTTGALISNYLPLLYNSEVVFKVSTSHLISSPNIPSALGPSASNPMGGHQIGHHHPSMTRNDAIVLMTATNEPILTETLDREAFNIHSPIHGFADTSLRAQSDLCVDVFRMYFRLDQTRLALWHLSSGSVPSTPHTAVPSMTPNAMLTADEIFSAEWSSMSGTHIGPLTTEDWLIGRNITAETSSRKSQFTSKWSGSFEMTSSHFHGTGGLSTGGNTTFGWPAENSNRNAESLLILSQLTNQVFGGSCLGDGIAVNGPITLPEYQQMLCGSSDSSPASSSSSHSHMSQNHQPSHMTHIQHHMPSHDSTAAGLKTHQNIEVLPDPVAIVRYGEEGSMELPVTSLHAWEKLNLRPLSPPKDVTYFVLAPSHILPHAMSYFRQLSAVYSQCNLGSHSFDSALADTNGVVACTIPTGTDEFNRKICSNGAVCVIGPSPAPTSASSFNGSSNGLQQATGADQTFTGISPNPSSGLPVINTADQARFVWGSIASSNTNPQYPTISPYAITDEQLKGYEEWASKIADRLSTTRQYNKSIIIYVVSPFTLEGSTSTYAGDARSAMDADTAGTTRSQEILAQKSSVTLLRAVWAAVRKSNVRNLIVHGVGQNRVTSPALHLTQLKETAFNVYTKCRRVLLGEVSRDQREPPKLYEPLFVLGKPSPVVGGVSGVGASGAPERDFTLHVAYVLTSRTMTWSLCDSVGEILECSTLPTYSTITLALCKLLEKVVQTIVDVGAKWKLVIGKLGIMSPGELVEWNQAIKDYFVSKSNSQLVEQVSLVALNPAGSLDVLPSSIFPEISAPISLTSSNAHTPNISSGSGSGGPAHPINADQRYSVSMYGNLDQSSQHHPYEAPKSIAIYDSKPDPDAWDNDLLAQSHTLTFNPQWHHASLWGSDSSTPLTTSLYHIYRVVMSSGPNAGMKAVLQVDTTTDPSVIHPTIRHITRHYHQLSWLNVSPVSINRVDNLPMHFRLVRKLSNLHHAQSQS